MAPTRCAGGARIFTPSTTRHLTLARNCASHAPAAGAKMPRCPAKARRVSAVTEHLSIQQRARQFPCSCMALPGEYCRTWDGRKTYNVHLYRLKQENGAWHQAHDQPAPATGGQQHDR